MDKEHVSQHMALLECHSDKMQLEVRLKAARKEVNNMHQEIGQMRRYVFVKICHMFSSAPQCEDGGVDV